MRGIAAEVILRDDVDATFSFARDGLQWTVDMGDPIGAMLYTKGHHEGPEIDAVVAWLSARRHSPVVVDAGANVGTTSLPFAAAGYRVVAIEPVPQTLAMLHANVDNNGFADRITCVPLALADARGEVEMRIAKGSGQSEVSIPDTEGREAQRLRQEVVGKITVQSARLEDVLRDLGISSADVALVWADVQGSEASVIRGAPGLWAAGVPLYAEVDPFAIRVHEGMDEFIALVGEHFSSFVPSSELPGGTPTPVASFGRFVQSIPSDAYTNALLIPHVEE